MGKYIYVGKFNGNNDYLHFSHFTAYKNKSGKLVLPDLPFPTVCLYVIQKSKSFFGG